MDDDWPSTYKQIQDSNTKIYQKIDLAIRHEENENPQLALINYKLGIVLIDGVLNIPVSVPEGSDNIDDSWKKACEMIHKIKRTRIELLQRISALSVQYPPESAMEMDENAVADFSKRPRTQTELATEIATMQGAHDTKLELIFLCENVRLYRISGTGEVSTTSEDCILSIFFLPEDAEQNIDSTFFFHAITVDSDAVAVELNASLSWVYPLIPNVTACYHTEYGAFIFPDLQSENVGSMGIVVPPASQKLLSDILEAILLEIFHQTDDDEHTARAPRATSQVISDNIVKGAHYISKGLICGSTKVGELMSKGTPYVMSKMNKAPENVEPVSERVMNGVEMAKTATGYAANATGYVAGKVGSATMALGHFLAPHVQTQGSKLLTRTMGYSQEEAMETVSNFN